MPIVRSPDIVTEAAFGGTTAAASWTSNTSSGLQRYNIGEVLLCGSPSGHRLFGEACYKIACVRHLTAVFTSNE